MRWYRDNWYLAGGVLFVIEAYILAIWGGGMDMLLKFMTMSVMALLFHQYIWVGLCIMLFGVAQFIVHGILINKRAGTIYNPGLASVILLFFPLCAAYIIYIYMNMTVHWWDCIFVGYDTKGQQDTQASGLRARKRSWVKLQARISDMRSESTKTAARSTSLKAPLTCFLFPLS